MLKYKIGYTAITCIIVALIIPACKKTEQGFLSNNMYYIENPLTTSQGGITVSSSLVADGSTTPLSVMLTKVVNADGKDVDSILTKTDSIAGFSDAVTYLDSTLALLGKKLTVTTAKPLSINSTGGRIQLTPATQYVAPGTYTISVKASNVRGAVDLPNACQIIIGSSGGPDTVYAGTYAGTFNLSSGSYLSGIATPGVNLSYSATAINKIIYKFVDKTGALYNAKTGGIISRTGRWSMKQFDPYYPQVLTDSSVEYQFPSVPNQFPVFTNPGINGVIPRGNYGVFPAIPAAYNDSGYPVFVFLDMAFFAKGTFVVTVTFSDITWL